MKLFIAEKEGERTFPLARPRKYQTEHEDHGDKGLCIIAKA